MTDACTPDNVIGKLAGMMDSGGVIATDGAVDKLDKSGKSLYHNTRSKGGSESLEDGNQHLSDTFDNFLDDHIVPITEHSPLNIRGVLTHGLKPTDYLPESVTTPILDYVDSFAYANMSRLGSAKGEYRNGLRKVIKGIDLESLPASLQGEAKHWFRDLEEGYPFYGKQGNILTWVISNVTANNVDFSGNILAGNPFELIVKLPTVYGVRGAGKAVVKALEETDGNLWAKIPELEAKGYYGFPDQPTNNPVIKASQAYNKLADSVMAITDRPLKNIAWAAKGTEGIEKIAFKNRLGNDSRITRNPLGRGILTFTNYTLGTYHLLGSMIVGLTNPQTASNAARGLATWAGLTMALGGQAAVIPEPLAFILKKSDPGYSDWEEQNLTPIGKLVRPGGITALGISSQMVTRAFQRFGSSVGKAAEKFSYQDYAGMGMDLADAGLSLSTTIRNPLGNPRLQKVLRSTRELFEGEISEDEYYESLKTTAMPFLKEAN